jgi:hypothetical protein
VTMTAGPALTTGCPKNPLTRLPLPRPPERRPDHHVPARQRGFCPSRRLRHASDISVAGDDPVNEGDPSGLYSYHYSWALGDVGSADSVFQYMANHLHEVFPFSTGKCERLSLGEKCDFHPVAHDPFNDDHLHVEKLGSTSFTLEVDDWCQARFLWCVAGDPPGSTITFAIGRYPDSQLSWTEGPITYGFSTCSGYEDVLSQDANSKGATFATNLLAPSMAEDQWHQQAISLSKDLGGGASGVYAIKKPGWWST